MSVVLLSYILNVMLCMENKKNVDNKKKIYIFVLIIILHREVYMILSLSDGMLHMYIIHAIFACLPCC